MKQKEAAFRSFCHADEKAIASTYMEVLISKKEVSAIVARVVKVLKEQAEVIDIVW